MRRVAKRTPRGIARVLSLISCTRGYSKFARPLHQSVLQELGQGAASCGDSAEPVTFLDRVTRLRCRRSQSAVPSGSAATDRWHFGFPDGKPHAVAHARGIHRDHSQDVAETEDFEALLTKTAVIATRPTRTSTATGTSTSLPRRSVRVSFRSSLAAETAPSPRPPP